MSKEIYVKNLSKSPYCVPKGDGTVIDVPAGAVVLVPEEAVSERMFEKKILEKVDGPDAEETSVETGGGSEPDTPLTVEQMAQKLIDEPELLSEDDMTGAGVPTVDALNKLFEREDIDAKMRDQIWELVEDGCDD